MAKIAKTVAERNSRKVTVKKAAKTIDFKLRRCIVKVGKLSRENLDSNRNIATGDKNVVVEEGKTLRNRSLRLRGSKTSLTRDSKASLAREAVTGAMPLVGQHLKVSNAMLKKSKGIQSRPKNMLKEQSIDIRSGRGLVETKKVKDLPQTRLRGKSEAQTKISKQPEHHKSPMRKKDVPEGQFQNRTLRRKKDTHLRSNPIESPKLRRKRGVINEMRIQPESKLSQAKNKTQSTRVVSELLLQHRKGAVRIKEIGGQPETIPLREKNKPQITSRQKKTTDEFTRPLKRSLNLSQSDILEEFNKEDDHEMDLQTNENHASKRAAKLQLKSTKYEPHMKQSFVKLRRHKFQKPNENDEMSTMPLKLKYTIKNKSPSFKKTTRLRNNTAKESHIYDFPSQSSISETDDVTSTVIQKLIKEGKVSIAKHKNNKPLRKKNIIKPAVWRKVAKNLSIPYPDKNKQKIIKKSKPEIMDIVPDIQIPIDDDNHFDTALDSFTTDEIPSVADIQKPIPSTSFSFSKLAQKVMTKQTAQAASTSTPNRPVKNIFDKVKLLEIARTFVNHSTPNKSIAGPSSPRKTLQQPIGNLSPWRIEDKSIPGTFYFSRNKDNLPSYSSDVIASSQCSTPLIDNSKKISNIENISAIENISIIENISNIENISPVKSIPVKIKSKMPLTNANPRHGLPDRSPLKAINILEVITLPRRLKAKPINTTQFEQSKENSIHQLQQSISNRSIKEPSILQVADKENANLSLTDKNNLTKLFGFDDSDLSDDPSPNKIDLPNRKSLRKKLNSLKRLLPAKPTRVSHRAVRTIFKPTIEKQTDIRQMLSSTMIGTNEKKSNSSEKQRIEFVDESLDAITHDDGNDLTNSAISHEVNLFGDLVEPQTSFDSTIKIRTYERRPQRKANRKHRDFVMLPEDSEEEEEIVVKRKRTKRDKKQEAELKSFVEKFNSMCEDVNKYELIVEADKSDKNSSG